MVERGGDGIFKLIGRGYPEAAGAAQLGERREVGVVQRGLPNVELCRPLLLGDLAQLASARDKQNPGSQGVSTSADGRSAKPDSANSETGCCDCVTPGGPGRALPEVKAGSWPWAGSTRLLGRARRWCRGSIVRRSVVDGCFLSRVVAEGECRGGYDLAVAISGTDGELQRSRLLSYFDHHYVPNA